MHIKTYKALGLLLDYPKQELISELDLIIDVFKKEQLLQGEILDNTIDFIKYLKDTELLELQKRYVALFDNTRSLSLYLFEHVHGDSKERGQAMVDLTENYKRLGLNLQQVELPDFLPTFLEYISIQSMDEAKKLLGEPVNIFAVLSRRMHKNNVEYAPIFDALVKISGATPDDKIVAEVAEQEKPIDFDKEYEEEPVTFGFDSKDASCNV
jgi:nitrate reductase delta subunit